MPQSRLPSSQSHQIVADLAVVPRINTLGPIAARFIYSLRLIAMHQRVKRDPVPELATRLASVDIAAKALGLSQAITAMWPENIHVSCFCAGVLTHDEVTIGAMMDAATARDRAAFEAAVVGLVRPARIAALWDTASDLVMAEMHAA